MRSVSLEDRWLEGFIQVSGVGCRGVEVLYSETWYETTFKANRRISNIEPQNVEGRNRFAQSF
jgi:hypothetical protein